MNTPPKSAPAQTADPTTRPRRCSACARCRCSTTTISSSIARIRARRSRAHRRTSPAGPARRRRDVRTGRRLRPSRSHRDLPVHDRGDRRGGRSGVCVRRRRGGAAACGVEAVLHRLAGIDMGRLRGGVQETVVDGRRRRAAGDAVARLGDHDRDRHARLLVDGVAGGLVPRVAGRRLRAAEGPVAGAPRGAVGLAVVLSRVQHRERRTSARDGSLRRDRR